jgi:hypothetical protein
MYRALHVNDGWFMLRNLRSNRCVKVKGSTSNYVEQWACFGDSNQLWKAVAVGDGLHKLVNYQTGKVLEFEGNSRTGNGTRATQWPYDGSPDQKFKLVLTETPTTDIVHDTVYELRPMHATDKCIDVYNASTASGTKLHLWSCSTGLANKFRVIYKSDGYYTLQNVRSGHCVDVLGESTFDGAVIQQYTCHGNANQQWQPVKLSDGTYKLINRKSGKAMDVEGWSTSNGANIAQRTFDYSPDERYQMIPID